MKILLAFDSFKGCLTSHEIMMVAAKVIHKTISSPEIKGFFVADGGEGTLDALTHNSEGQIVSGKFTNLEGKKITAAIGIINNVCIIESAKTLGLGQSNCKNVDLKTSKGLGEQIKFALDLGYRKFAIGLGGSGTNDAGLGLVGELGFQFFDEHGNKVEPLLKNIYDISRIDKSNVDHRIYKSEFTILSDVKNPLCGKNGATYVYGPQKGLPIKQLKYYDRGISKFSKVASNYFGFNKSTNKGAGAAGGLGYALLQFLNGKVVSGVNYILKVLHVDEAIKNSDIVFTGEGRTDIQTANGKLAVGISKLAKRYQKPVILISGAILEDAYKLHNYGITYLSSIQDHPISLENAMKPHVAKQLFAHRIEETIRLLLVGKNL